MTPDLRQLACSRFIQEWQNFEQAATVVETVIKSTCKDAGLRYSGIEVRAKEVSSFIKKMYLKSYDDPWFETTDKVGGRIITSTLIDLESIHKYFDENRESEQLRILSIEDKSELAEPSELYYAGIHIQAVVPEVHLSDGERIECEIQLRTKAQDAWATAAHGSLYKGVIEPTKMTRRRLYRLSVLSEMFDQEVKIAMNEIKSDPAYENAVLLRAVERLYLPIANAPGEDQLSLEVLSYLQEFTSSSDSGSFVSELEGFVKSNIAKISKIIETYGSRSEFDEQWSYWLFSQPEILVILKLVSSSPNSLSEAIAGSEIEDAVRNVYRAWGTEMPDPNE